MCFLSLAHGFFWNPVKLENYVMIGAHFMLYVATLYWVIKSCVLF